MHSVYTQELPQLRLWLDTTVTYTVAPCYPLPSTAVGSAGIFQLLLLGICVMHPIRKLFLRFQFPFIVSVDCVVGWYCYTVLYFWVAWKGKGPPLEDYSVGHFVRLKTLLVMSMS